MRIDTIDDYDLMNDHAREKKRGEAWSCEALLEPPTDFEVVVLY